MNIFKKKPTAKEVLRESKRDMANATRGIEEEISALQAEENKLVAELGKTVRTGNEVVTKILSQDLVRLRRQIAHLQGSRAQMGGIATHTQALDEIGVDVASQLSAAPKGKTAGKKTEDVGTSSMSDLEDRLAAPRSGAGA